MARIEARRATRAVDTGEELVLHPPVSHLERCWTVVLAGGNGSRLESWVRERLGQELPKQYCAPNGGRTLLERALDRCRALVPARRIVTVVGPDHRRHLPGGSAEEIPGTVLGQPADRGTAIGLALAAELVFSRDPGATLIVQSASCEVRPAKRFVGLLRAATRYALRLPAHAVLLGAAPTRPLTDYEGLGWIQPDRPRGPLPLPVRAVAYAPTSPEELSSFGEASLLDSTAMAASLTAMRWLLAHCLPDASRRLAEVRPLLADGDPSALDDPAFHRTLEAIYGHLAPADLGHDVLQRSPPRLAVLPMSEVDWTDWGTPQRAEAALHRFGPEPSNAPRSTPARTPRASATRPPRRSAR